ncbi:hypothetical protein T01_11954 [Trichinella spiralis]|uniref:Uncharacterized protein n=1 Tax=Trichinella spiralis TaxID=6334 RepID=A0A0V1A1F0_TRISP|nr:hypothetical protein T01_11954 [Trichinella spiralis]
MGSVFNVENLSVINNTVDPEVTVFCFSWCVIL